MKKVMILTTLSAMLLFGCNSNNKQKQAQDADNPFFSEYSTTFHVPPFDKIKVEHYMPAYKKGIEEHNQEIDAIVNNTEAPTFANTIEAMDNSGRTLQRVSAVFNNLNGSTTNKQMQQVAKDVSPLVSKHYDDIAMNSKLFVRVKAVYDKKDKLSLTIEQQKLLKDTYNNFVRNGANLTPAKQDVLRDINKELSSLSLKFNENHLAEVNKFKLIIDKKEDLVGLPQSAIDAAAMSAKDDGKDGKWLFTIQKPSLIPFLQFSDKRDLREKMYKAYTTQCDHNDKYDNKEIAKKMVVLRFKKAQLLGYKTFADYVLSDRMAKSPEKVFNLLNKLMQAGNKVAKQERADLQKMIVVEGGKFKLAAWDWWYYTEKLRKQKYDFDQELVRPYFKLENVRKGMFEVAHKLYGITFTERHDLPIYHPDVKVFNVKDVDGTHLAVLYMDFYPRASKSSGAWMDSFVKQRTENDKRIAPVITIVTNFSKPTADKPSLLTYEEVTTMFHEFGHSLHGMLSNCKYYSQSGTSVPRDFVEMPSQIMENWPAQPEVLNMIGKNYKTGEVIPEELIKKMKAAGNFNQGFELTEFIAAGLLDMYWHTITDTIVKPVAEFEKEVRQKIGLIPEIEFRYRTSYFAHIFSGGYAVGYYGYSWAEILDADAFEMFKEHGIFDKATATSFRKNIIERGGSDEAMTLYKNFRGQEPTIDALLKRRGLK